MLKLATGIYYLIIDFLYFYLLDVSFNVILEIHYLRCRDLNHLQKLLFLLSLSLPFPIQKIMQFHL